MKICIVQPTSSSVSETFLDAQARGLGSDVQLLYGREASGVILNNDIPVLSQSWIAKAKRKCERHFLNKNWEWETTTAFASVFKHCDVVLAQYGVVGVQSLEACMITRKPLVVHFHGYDASRRDLIEKYATYYRQVFQYASAVISVSRAMSEGLLRLGCPASKIVLNVYGVRPFSRKADVLHSGPNLVSVGRFVDKKCPVLSILAFERVAGGISNAKLTMIGDGPLLGTCKDLVRALKLDNQIVFKGAQPHSAVLEEMLSSRAFIQHSVTAQNGDSEGTPVAVLEASAAGLPVVATRHGGIPDVAIDGVSALLAEERCMEQMACDMELLLKSPECAAKLGANGIQIVSTFFSAEQSLHRLNRILEAACTRLPLTELQEELNSVILDAAGHCSKVSLNRQYSSR